MTDLAIRKPLAYLEDGTPIWPYSGSEDDDPQDGGFSSNSGGNESDPPREEETNDDDELDDDGLNSKGRNAIAAERKSADRAKNALKPWNALRREFGVTPDEVREMLAKSRSNAEGGQNSPDGEKPINVEEIRRQAAREAAEKVNSRLVSAAIRAEAAELLANPADAPLFLSTTDYEVTDDGEVDADQIRMDLKALLRDRPYLGKARRGDGRDGGDPDFDGGPRRGHARLSMDDLIRRTASSRR